MSGTTEQVLHVDRRRVSLHVHRPVLDLALGVGVVAPLPLPPACGYRAVRLHLVHEAKGTRGHRWGSAGANNQPQCEAAHRLADAAGDLLDDILDLAPGCVRKEGSGLTLLVITACPHCLPPRPSHRQPLCCRVGHLSMGNQRDDVENELAEDVREGTHRSFLEGPPSPRQRDRPSTAYSPVAGAFRPSPAC